MKKKIDNTARPHIIDAGSATKDWHKCASELQAKTERFLFVAGPSRSSSQRHTTHHHPTASDEELARQLQEQYDAEMGGGTSKQPPSPIRVGSCNLLSPT